ncbi:magnesium ion transporter [Puccinia graminis f. sp. tritici]|uniref:Magnesium transporter n=1 Tax=Puccinia graminis f. sp. tritici TaxID=56615 RepID=A0A5B0LIW2_PUCGR|nr:magnesium ion transporter [Puccinia graminis f. sp. tritici]
MVNSRLGSIGTLRPFSTKKRLIPSFLPSNRTLEFRLNNNNNHLKQNKHKQPSTILRFNQQNSTIKPPPDPIESIRDNIDKPFLASRNSLPRRDDLSAIRSILIDRNARILSSRALSKSEICAQNRLQPRDLRKIDSRISNVVPSILVRDEAIIFNVLNIRALIRADSILIFEDPSSPSLSHNHTSSPSTTSSSSTATSSEKSTSVNEKASPESSATTRYSIRSAFLHNLLNNLVDHHNPNQAENSHEQPNQCSPKSTELPYEFRALETMLGSVATTLESELGVLKTLVSSLLDGLEQNIEREKLKQLLLYSRRLSAFNSRALLVQRCLDEILENEQDMANAYLSEKILNKSPRQVHDHEEFEQLLESFSKYVEEIVHEGTSTLTNIKSTEEIIDLILDSNRNTLLALDLKVSIGTMGLAVGALTAGMCLPICPQFQAVISSPNLTAPFAPQTHKPKNMMMMMRTGLFGMNLRTHMEADPYAFYVVTGLTLVGVMSTIGYGCRRLYRLRRVGLSSVASPSSSAIAAAGCSRRIISTGSAAKNGGILDWDVPRLVYL